MNLSLIFSSCSFCRSGAWLYFYEHNLLCNVHVDIAVVMIILLLNFCLLWIQVSKVWCFQYRRDSWFFNQTHQFIVKFWKLMCLLDVCVCEGNALCKCVCVGGAAAGPEPCSLSFRSAQSGISSLTEMLLSLCQIRPSSYTHVTSASGRRSGRTAQTWRRPRRVSPGDRGRDLTTGSLSFRKKDMTSKPSFNLAMSHCASRP